MRDMMIARIALPTMPTPMASPSGLFRNNRAHYLSNVLAVQAAKDIIKWLPKAYEDGKDLEAREKMA
ncbi:MAG: iron-containing alcohol dehydrogenase, partial [Eggerthellaceae bacterium]|nr:iron-containing alcohol dehydrogenase [Eggerthellaceae bacterium]